MALPWMGVIFPESGWPTGTKFQRVVGCGGNGLREERKDRQRMKI